MPDGTEDDADETPAETGGGATEEDVDEAPARETEEAEEEPSRPPEGFADEGTTVGAWDWDSPSGYWRVSAIALVAVALIGIVANFLEGSPAWVPDVDWMQDVLAFDWAHNVVHVVLAAIALVFGFTGLRTSDASKPVAGVIGVVYLLLGIAGFFGGFVDLLDDLVALHLEVGENVFHLVLGAWGAFVGFVSDAPY